MTNVVVITGRLCADPESRQTQSGGESTLVYFRDVVTAMKAAEILNKEMKKSD